MRHEPGEVSVFVGVVGNDDTEEVFVVVAVEESCERYEEADRVGECEFELVRDEEAWDVWVTEVEAVVADDEVVVAAFDEFSDGVSLGPDGADHSGEVDGEFSEEEASLGVGGGVVEGFDEFAVWGVMSHEVEGASAGGHGDVMAAFDEMPDDGEVTRDVSESPRERTEDDSTQASTSFEGVSTAPVQHPADLTESREDAIRCVLRKFK